MKILVYDVAAEYGGALAILKNAYNYALKDGKDMEWVFILSKAKFNETENIKVVNYPEVKKSWITRYIFDKIKAPKIIKHHNPDLIVNLQNIAIQTRIKQVLYMHQSLPFCDFKFKINDAKMWFYQNIIGKMIKKSCRKADEIIVQTNWIKNAIVKNCKILSSKISVKSPEIDKTSLIPYCGTATGFFYPAGAVAYKNHKTIIEASKILTQQGVYYQVEFTLNGDENAYTRELKYESEKSHLNIIWSGELTHNEVLERYSHMILIFPSYIETFGLPLLEAKESGSPIIASKTEFAREICGEYEKCYFFDRFDGKALSELMKIFLSV